MQTIIYSQTKGLEKTKFEVVGVVNEKINKPHEHWFDDLGKKICSLCNSRFDIPVIIKYVD